MNEPARIRVLSVDDHPLVREGLAALINAQADMCVVGQGSTGHEAINSLVSFSRTWLSWTSGCLT